MCRSAQCGVTAPNSYRQATWRRTTDCAGSWIIMKNDASTPRWWRRDLDTHTKKKTKKLPKTPAEFAQLLGLSPKRLFTYYPAGAESQHAEKRRCSRFSRRGAASLPRPAAAHPFGKEKKIHTDRRQRRREKVARAGGEGEKKKKEKKKERVGR